MDIKKIFGKVAPFLSVAASLVPGGGPAVQIAADVLTRVTGTEVKPESISDTLTKLSGTEEGRLKLQESEQQYQMAMKQLKFEHVEQMVELENADRASARDREKTVKDRVPAILAMTVTLGFFGMLLLVALHGIPPTAHDFVVIMLTSLATAWVSIIAYYFGSSSGSDHKTDLLAQAPPIAKS